MIPQPPTDSGRRLLILVGVERAMESLESVFESVGVSPGIITPRVFAVAEGSEMVPRILAIQQENGFLSIMLLIDDTPYLVRTKPLPVDDWAVVERELSLTMGFVETSLEINEGLNVGISMESDILADRVKDWVASSGKLSPIVKPPPSLAFDGTAIRDRVGTFRLDPVVNVMSGGGSMIVPNLASRPHLNTRPVWLVTATAAFIALVFAVVNTSVWLKSSRSLEEKIVEYDRLELEYQRLTTEVGDQAENLNRVPWKSLAARVNAVNAVILEHEFSWIGLLDDIERVLPYDVRLTKITPKVNVDTVNLSLTAIGRTRDALLDFFDTLIEDPSFSDPTPLSEITPEESGLGYVFTMTVVHHPGKVSP